MQASQIGNGKVDVEKQILLQPNDIGSDAEKRLAEAKEALKRTKERAKSMLACQNYKMDEMGVTSSVEKDTKSIRANTTSHRGRIGYDGCLGSSWARSLSGRTPGYGTSKKKKKMNRTTMMGGNSSISSISELEPVVCFHDSECSNMSSLSQLTTSNDSLQLSLSNWITQGPDFFDAETREKKDSLAPKIPKRFDSVHNLDCGNDSNSSLDLEDIVEESNHSCDTATTNGRQWSEGAPAKSEKGVSMPVRADSVSEH